MRVGGVEVELAPRLLGRDRRRYGARPHEHVLRRQILGHLLPLDNRRRGRRAPPGAARQIEALSQLPKCPVRHRPCHRGARPARSICPARYSSRWPRASHRAGRLGQLLRGFLASGLTKGASQSLHTSHFTKRFGPLGRAIFFLRVRVWAVVREDR